MPPTEDDIELGWDDVDEPGDPAGKPGAAVSATVSKGLPPEPEPPPPPTRKVSMPFAAALNWSGPPSADDPTPVPDDKKLPPLGERVTVPPPVPTDELAARMMDDEDEADNRSSDVVPRAVAGAKALRPARQPSLSERHRAILENLDADDPEPPGMLGGRPVPIPDPPPPREPRGSAPARPTAPSPGFGPRVARRGDRNETPRVGQRDSAGPPSIEIETQEVAFDDLDEDLLRDTPVPPKPPVASFDELDELPIDDVLKQLSVPVPAPRPKVVPVKTPAVPSLPVTARPASDWVPPSFDDVGRATLTGYDPNDPLDQIHDRYVVGDYSGALELAENVLKDSPNNGPAKQYAETCREMLRQMYVSRVGDGNQIPRVIMTAEQLRWLTLNHRAGFLLSCIDGNSSIDEVLDVSGMGQLDALKLLHELQEQGVIAITATMSRPPGAKK